MRTYPTPWHVESGFGRPVQVVAANGEVVADFYPLEGRDDEDGAEKRAELMVSAAALRDANERLRGLVENLYDREPCRFDHNGNCQEHLWFGDDSTCPHQQAKDELAALSGAEGGP